MLYQVKAAVPVAISPAGPVEHPKIGGYVEIPSREHAEFLQSRGILAKGSDQVNVTHDDEIIVKNLHKMTLEEMQKLPEVEFLVLALEDADMTREPGQSFEDFFKEVIHSLSQMSKMAPEPEPETTEKRLSDMTKNELGAYAKKYFKVDIDKRKPLPKLLKQVKRLQKISNKGE